MHNRSTRKESTESNDKHRMHSIICYTMHVLALVRPPWCDTTAACTSTSNKRDIKPPQPSCRRGGPLRNLKAITSPEQGDKPPPCAAQEHNSLARSCSTAQEQPAAILWASQCACGEVGLAGGSRPKMSRTPGQWPASRASK